VERYAQSVDSGFVRELLQPLVGEPLTGMWRAVGQVFEFGEQRAATNRRGEPITRGDFQLKFIAADWRVVQSGRIILGSSDLDTEEQFYEAETPPEGAHSEEAWRLARAYFDAVETAEFVVQSADVSEFGEVTVRLSPDVVIQSFASSAQDLDLWWFMNERTDVSCLVGPSGHNVGGSTVN
jgi:hypothetical protein